MTAKTQKRGLGRGLDALFQDARNEEASFTPKIKRANEIVSVVTQQQKNTSTQQKISIDKLKPGNFQPRRKFDGAALDNLAESIVIHGVLQPLLVRPITGDMYEIIAGERRWRAAQKAQIHDLPVIIQELNDNDVLEISLIENLQREDLTVLEEAEGYQRLMNEFHHTQDILAHHLSKSRSHIANTLRLLKLPEKVKQYMQEGILSAGHARCLIKLNNAEEIAEIVIKRGLNVRQTENLVKNKTGNKITAKKSSSKKFIQKDVDILALEEKMSSLLGMKVTIENAGSAGYLRIGYTSLEQLDDVLERLSYTPQKQTII